MTLQDLLDDLGVLHPSSRSAPVVIRHGDIEDLEILSVSYDSGEVIIECEDDKAEIEDEIDD